MKNFMERRVKELVNNNQLMGELMIRLAEEIDNLKERVNELQIDNWVLENKLNDASVDWTKVESGTPVLVRGESEFIDPFEDPVERTEREWAELDGEDDWLLGSFVKFEEGEQEPFVVILQGETGPRVFRRCKLK